VARLKVGVDLSLLQNAQTVSRAYTASRSKGTMRSLGKNGRRVKLFTPIHLVPRQVDYTCTGTTSPLYLLQLQGTVNGSSTAVIEMLVKY
jgi:hypothetical protein